jgi:hypothetical protein
MGLGSRSLNAVPIFLEMTFKLSPMSNISPPVFVQLVLGWSEKWAAVGSRPFYRTIRTSL